jgi:4'-phosphopantetheinyl transferase EntD
VAATREDVAGVALYPEEAAAIERAVEARRREFATGRACARAALQQLGFPPQAIPVANGGEPRWPAGAIGSITHCREYRACAVARTADLAALGIDAEPNEPMPERVLNAIAHDDEPTLIAALPEVKPRVHWDRLLFSAKESAFKVWHGLTGHGLAFEQIAVEFDPPAESFTAELSSSGRSRRPAPRRLEGRWTVDDGILLTAVAPTRAT